jgi:hypothetical protein
MKRKLTTYGDYFLNFYNTLEKKVQNKIDYVFELVATVEHIPKRFFDSMSGTMEFLKSGLNMKVIFIGYFAFLMPEI